MDLSKFKQLYLETSQEQLRHLDEGIAQLEADITSKNGLDMVYINAHTLVSKSMLMGYVQIGEVSHLIEKLFFAVKSGKLTFSQEMLSALHDASDQLHTSLDIVAKDGNQPDLSETKKTIEQYLSNI